MLRNDQAYLDSRFVPPFNLDSEKLSTSEKACYSQGIYYLQHATLADYLPEIFESGFLIPRNQQKNPHGYMAMMGEGSVTYLQPYQYQANLSQTVASLSGSVGYSDGIESGDLCGALLLFSVKLLDECSEYYGNHGWIDYGAKTSRSTLAENMRANSYENISQYGEICFEKPIDLSKYLIDTWIHPLVKEDVVKTFENAGIEPKFNISAYAYHPEIIYSENSEVRMMNRDPENDSLQVIKSTDTDPIFGGNRNWFNFFNNNKSVGSLDDQNSSLSLNESDNLSPGFRG